MISNKSYVILVLALLFCNHAFAGNISDYAKPAETNGLKQSAELTTKSIERNQQGTLKPESFGAIGDGIADDTLALRIAFLSAGINGIVSGDGIYKVTSLLNYVECKRVGKGKIVFNNSEWDFSTELRVKSSATLLYHSNTTVATGGYNHFPNAAEYNGVIVVAMNHNNSHGQANNQAISLPQLVSQAGNLLINGRYALLGKVKASAYTRVRITSTGDDRARKFTINGTKQGKPISFTMNGANKSTVNSKANQLIDTITSITVDAPCNGKISIGLFVLPGNIEVRYSTDKAKTFSEPIAVGDGLSDGKNLYYSSSLGVSNDGVFVVVYNKVPIVERGYVTMRRASRDGRLWSNEIPITYDVKPTTTLGLYGEIKSTPSGKLLMSTYAGKDNWVFVSEDKGLTWSGKLFASQGSPKQGYSETGIAVIDENNWVLVSRVEYVVTPLVQFITTDAGQTFTQRGPINVLAGGGDVSPQLHTLLIKDQLQLALFWMSRKSQSHPTPTPDYIIAAFASASSVKASASNWSSVKPVVLTSGKRSGYPTILCGERTTNCLLFYGDESNEYSSSVKTITFDLTNSSH